MSIDVITQLFTSSFFGVFKLGILILEFLYGIFAVIVLRQVQKMNIVIHQDNFAGILFMIALIHFVLVIVLFFATFVLL